jgi:hypothetical protein
MTFAAGLRAELEAEEKRTVGTSFGGGGEGGGSYSVVRARDWILENYGEKWVQSAPAVQTLREINAKVPAKTFQGLIASAIRFSFLIELTDLKVGSTKMKTRWLPGYILMPREGTFEPFRGVFEPGNDPRAASFDDCYNIFERVLGLIRARILENGAEIDFLSSLQKQTRVPYEFPVGYREASAVPAHTPANVAWIENEDIVWLVKAREILHQHKGEHVAALRQIEAKKLEVKVYKTDRALTGKDKTNRAKRWEVLFGDFQFATLANCWSVERKLTEELVFFEGFPEELKQRFVEEGLVVARHLATRCPITLAPLNFVAFATAMLNATHGRSDYQIGHLTPLKRGGHHIGTNIAWQSADGNRIQGDLSLEETIALLTTIAERREAHVANPSVDVDAPR